MRHHDLVVIGTGSGNAVVDDSFADLDVAVVEEEHRFGGTCLNVGCIPSKMLAHTAGTVDEIRRAATYGVDAELRGVRWRDVQDRIYGRLDPIGRDGREARLDTPWITVHTGHARFTGPRTLDVGGTAVTADQIVVAAGSRPVVPPPVTESGLPFETSDTVMRIDAPPHRLAVLGGGYIAAELAHVFAAMGTEIVLVESADVLLGPQDHAVGEQYTKLAAKRHELHLGHELTRLEGEPRRLRLVLDDDTTIEADTLLVAVGRTPNSDRLDLDAAGVETHDDGRIRVDEHQRTSADGVWALGDVSTPIQLKHVANREADVVRHNLRHPDDLASTGHDVVPAAVFTDPPIASVGATEQSLRENGTPYVAGVARYSETAYGWALEDHTGFCKILAEPAGGRLLGAHILGPEAPTLIQPLVLAMTLDIPAATLAGRPYWIHPALTEVVRQALAALER